MCKKTSVSVLFVRAKHLISFWDELGRERFEKGQTQHQELNIMMESLILAQGKRWRRA